MEEEDDGGCGGEGNLGNNQVLPKAGYLLLLLGATAD